MSQRFLNQYSYTTHAPTSINEWRAWAERMRGAVEPVLGQLPDHVRQLWLDGLFFEPDPVPPGTPRTSDPWVRTVWYAYRNTLHHHMPELYTEQLPALTGHSAVYDDRTTLTGISTLEVHFMSQPDCPRLRQRLFDYDASIPLRQPLRNARASMQVIGEYAHWLDLRGLIDRDRWDLPYPALCYVYRELEGVTQAAYDLAPQEILRAYNPYLDNPNYSAEDDDEDELRAVYLDEIAAEAEGRTPLGKSYRHSDESTYLPPRAMRKQWIIERTPIEERTYKNHFLLSDGAFDTCHEAVTSYVEQYPFSAARKIEARHKGIELPRQSGKRVAMDKSHLRHEHGVPMKDLRVEDFLFDSLEMVRLSFQWRLSELETHTETLGHRIYGSRLSKAKHKPDEVMMHCTEADILSRLLDMPLSLWMRDIALAYGVGRDKDGWLRLGPSDKEGDN